METEENTDEVNENNTMACQCITRRYLAGAIAPLMALLSSCGPSKTEECRDILSLIQQSEAQRALGVSGRDEQLAEIQRYQTLVDDLVELPIDHSALQEHQTRLVDAYESVIVASTQYLEASNDDGNLSYPVGNAEAEAEVNTIQAQKNQAYNRVDLATGLFYTACSN
jgi:hypothetical protein